MRSTPLFFAFDFLLDLLREIVDASLEDGLVFVAGDVFGDLATATFAVCHFSENAAARRGESFDGEV